MAEGAAKSKKQRKVGRNRTRSGQNGRYINENRHEKSHIRRIKVHLKRYGEADKVAAKALVEYKVQAGVFS